MKSEKELLQIKDKINIPYLKQVMMESSHTLPLEFVKGILKRFLLIVKNDPNLLRIQQPVIVVGDIHGQYRDLMKITSYFPDFEKQHHQNVLFLGDYVDRGPQGMEVTLLLMSLKINYPKRIHLLRGNHESRQMTQLMNFYSECCTKYNQDVYFDVMDCFDALPLTCIINNNYFCVHGGISPSLSEVSEINHIKRFSEIPIEGVFCDLIWSDPISNEHGETGDGLDVAVPNTQRNCSFFFGKQLAKKFLKKNNLITILRAHEVHPEGYKQHKWPQWKDIPMIYTIFSAPNYCGTYGNVAAILTINKSQFNIRQFKQFDPKYYYFPLRFNAFNFTIPKLQENIDKVIKKIVKIWTPLKDQSKFNQCTPGQIIALYVKYQEQIKNKHQHQKKSKEQSELNVSGINFKVEDEKDLQELMLEHQGSSNTNKLQNFRESQEYFRESEFRPRKLSIPHQNK